MTIYHIDHYQFGKITISGTSYTRDLILLPGRIITNWWRKEGHVLHTADLADVLDAEPQLLVIGLGANSRMQISPGAEQALAAAGTEWIALPTDKACQEFNQRTADQEVAAALHLTC
jgi:hypothetical protein